MYMYYTFYEKKLSTADSLKAGCNTFQCRL